MEQNFNNEQIQEQLTVTEQFQEPVAKVTASKIYAKIRNIMLSIFALLFVSIMFYSASTYSYFSDSVNSTANRIAAGTLDVDIIEVNGEGTVVEPTDTPIYFTPSLNISKMYRIKNAGTLPMYVRAKVEISIDKNEADLPDNWRSLISYNFKVDNQETGTVGTWELRDGYYYYILPLDSGMVATLFDTISFSSQMGNVFENSTIEFTIICEATQVKSDAWDNSQGGNANTSGGTVSD